MSPFEYSGRERRSPDPPARRQGIAPHWQAASGGVPPSPSEGEGRGEGDVWHRGRSFLLVSNGSAIILPCIRLCGRANEKG